MKELNELRKDVEGRRQHELERHLREYRPQMAETVTQLRQAASELSEVSRVIKPIAERALKDYPSFPDDPPSVRKAVQELGGRCQAVLRLIEDKPKLRNSSIKSRVANPPTLLIAVLRPGWALIGATLRP